MNQVRAALEERLRRLEDHLAILVSIHLFVELLLDRWIEKRSPIARKILRDHRTYPFSVKLTLVFHMGGVPERLFRNLRSLNSLRNVYAHEIDVDLADRFDRGFTTAGGAPLFPEPKSEKRAIRAEPKEVGTRVLLAIRDATFGWLHGLMEPSG